MNRGRPKRGKMSPSAGGEDSTTAPHIFLSAPHLQWSIEILLYTVSHYTLLFLESSRHPPKRLCLSGRTVAVAPHRHGSGFRHQLPLDERACSGSVHENVQSTFVAPRVGTMSRTETRVALIIMVVERRARHKFAAVTHATAHVGAQPLRQS